MTAPAVVQFSPELVSQPTVVEQLAKVIAELPSIGRDGRASQQQGGYAYRGIEQITAHAAPLLAKHGVIFVPRVKAMETRDLTVNNKPWTDTILTVAYRIYGPAGDHIEAQVVGIGRDNSDKGANKALTQAFKYALIQTLCIADGKDDGDSETFEADAPREHPRPDIDRLRSRVDALDPDARDAFVAWKDDQGFPWPWPAEAVRAMEAHLDSGAVENPVGGDADSPAPDSGGPGGAETRKGSDDGGEGGTPSAALQGSPPGPTGYASWTKSALADECEKLGLPHAQPKDRLVLELRAYDALNPEHAAHDVHASERPF